MSERITPAGENYSRDDELFGHPKGLYVCFTTELWERFSFYGMKYLLLLYLTKYHLFPTKPASMYWALTPALSMRCPSLAA